LWSFPKQPKSLPFQNKNAPSIEKCRLGSRDSIVWSACQSGWVKAKHKTPAGNACSLHAWKAAKKQKKEKANRQEDKAGT